MRVQIKNNMKLFSFITRSKMDNDYIYLPVKKITRDIKKNEHFYLGDLVFDSYSSVSGNAKEVVKIDTIDNKDIYSLKIENDFKEKRRNKKGIIRNLNNLTKEDIYKKIIEFIDKDFSKKLECNNLIVSTIDMDPYEANELFIIKDYMDEILEVIDAYLTIFKIKNAYIVIKSKETEIISKLLNKLGTYPNIMVKVVEDFYPLGNNEVLKNYLKIKNINIFKCSFLYELYYVLKNNSSLNEKYITVNGNLIKKPFVIKVKLYSLLKDIIKKSDLLEFNETLYIVNGIMGGKIINLDNFIVTKNLRSLIINSRENLVTSECINCGLCKKVCPFNNTKCIKCGLCSYICPANIKLVKEGDYHE